MIDARYDPDASEAWRDAVAALGATMPRDLRTADQRAQDELAALALRCDSLQEQINVLSRQMAADRQERAAMCEAIERHADWMQVRELRGELAR